VLDQAERTARLLAESVDEEGIRLHPASTEAISRAGNRAFSGHPLLWMALGALLALILTRIF
jgi:ubiquinone biosynthesis protein